nr:class I SAM-dependent DNA methyltransferase [Thermococcus sp. P6]
MNRKDLANKIWRACDIMRRDDGTTGVLEYMEQLSWMIFLKVFEDLEKRFEDEAKFEGKEYTPIIDPKYRWSAWATKSDKELEKYFSEDELKVIRESNEHILIAFINRKLFPYLRSLKGTAEREKIASIFQEMAGNRMKSPYNLRDVIDLLNEIDFNRAEDSHILSQVYEELLLRLGKEGGVAGEFYTPRPVIRLMVKIVDPKIGESVFDPFCGSGGFLIESYKHMKEEKELTIEDYEILQNKTFYGQEKKPLPYLFGVMNSILHGLLNPKHCKEKHVGRKCEKYSRKRKVRCYPYEPSIWRKGRKACPSELPISFNQNGNLGFAICDEKAEEKREMRDSRS